MKLLLIILLIFALVIICLLLARWRVRCELVAGRLRLDLRLFRWKIKLFERQLLLPNEVAELLRAVAERDWARVVEGGIEKLSSREREGEQLQDGEPEKSTKKPGLSTGQIRVMIGGALAALDVKAFRLTVLVGGEPFQAAMMAGGVWAGLSAGLARLSAAVASWAGEPPEVGLLAPESSLLDSRIKLEMELSASIISVFGQILRRIWAEIW